MKLGSTQGAAFLFYKERPALNCFSFKMSSLSLTFVFPEEKKFPCEITKRNVEVVFLL